ncbi:hypothetical protein QNI19_06340 [Cytophagaceae bacterium DM2B3-1]|uniref:Cytochrome B n=1 Tax=Xanthocytophaga flava TaxID=3048013 RepID=A0ABT7CFM7_9BACT|nr:hypothetical protein [Xanthocytophaga flavus]MDJ1466545.1 hypothetical protein [Xanthocytophaga flavus]MDJ1492542.1 hypothetical protein [Xanthocytophaga flavus]
MYPFLLFFHSVFRWLVLLSLLYSIFRAFTGWRSARPFSGTDNATRHWTATIAHVQLMVGFTLYFVSPLVQAFRAGGGMHSMELAFFGMVHIACMLVAVVVITIGSALSKRRQTDREKFQTMLLWFLAGLFIIFIAIPWPFSPFAHRPYFRSF